MKRYLVVIALILCLANLTFASGPPPFPFIPAANKLLPGACTNGYTTTYNSTTGLWVCSTVAGGGNLKSDGTVGLTADWNLGAYNITAATFTGALAGNATTATALTANPANCSAGELALGITAAGVAECTATPSLQALTLTGANTLGLGTAGSAVGSFNLKNATSGYITVQPITGALGTPTLVLGTTYTDTKWCSYATATGFTCNENAPTGTGDVTGPASPTAGYLTKWGPSGKALVDGPKIGTFTDAKWCSFSTAGGLACTENTPAGGTPTAITVADEAADTSSFPLFVTAATGDLGPKTNSGLAFNAATGMLTVTGLTTGAGGITTAASAAPTNTFLDSDAPGADKEVAKTVGGYVDGADGAENGTLDLNVHEAGTSTSYATIDGKNTKFKINKKLETAGVIELGHASDTTISRVSAGLVAIEGSNVLTAGASPTLTGAWDFGGATSVEIPNGSGPTVDAAGEIAIDTTTDQLVYYGGAKRVLPYKQFSSFVIAAPAITDDINLLKAPYGMTILAINCIVQGTTSVTGQLQECDSAGANCADLDSDITCDSDGAADDGTLTDSAIASANWLRWKTTSVDGTPTFLTVTVTYSVVSD